MPKLGDIVADKYKIEQLIGVGGMGAVFSAIHQFTGKRVALKWMLPELAKDPDAVQRFMREAHAAGRISHPNVVDVYDVGQHADSYFQVMEFLQGEPLTTALARGDLTPAEVLALLLPAMRGVAAAHRQGVVHRDLKPDNIFLAYEEDGVRREAKVLDFGISKLSSDNQTNLRLTRTGAVVGTPYYMSPEQIRGSSKLDKRADIYSFGVILYESLTGQVPFHADTYGELVIEVATGTAKPLYELVPALPAELSGVVLRAMARDMNERYPSMESLISALEPFTSYSQGRLDSRSRRSLSGHDLASTHPATATEPNPLHQPITAAGRPATKPHLASTPFSAEGPEGELRRRNSLLGGTAFAIAAAGLVAGIWFITREPGSTETLVNPAAHEPPPAQAAQLPTPQPSAITPSSNTVRSFATAPTDSLGPARAAPQPSAAAPAIGTPGNAPTPQPESVPTHAGNGRVASAVRSSADRRLSTEGATTPNRIRPPRRRSEPLSVDSAPLRAAPSPTSHRARSGSLNVDEF